MQKKVNENVKEEDLEMGSRQMEKNTYRQFFDKKDTVEVELKVTGSALLVHML